MDSNRRTESIFIGALIIATLILGVIINIVYDKITISSICFAISITSLVYWFLGGIQGAGFSIGWVKLGGSVAALVGTFYIINQELRKDSSVIIKPNVETIVAFDKNTARPIEINVQQGETTIETIDPSSNKLWENYKLTLTDKLGIKINDFYLGKLEYSQLTKNNFFSDIEESNLDAEYFTLTINKSEHSERLGITIKATKFPNSNVDTDKRAKLEFEIKIDSSNNSEIETLRNKEIKIIKVDNRYFIIAGLQADYTIEKKYFQLSIKPLRLK